MNRWKRLRAPALALIAATMAVAGVLFGGDEALAERSIQIGQAKRTATVTVYIGKSEDVRTDASFVELTVGDPEVADVNPLTDRALSILGKKNGTTRVTAYAEGKKLIGVFDVEVVYDTSLLQHEIRRRFPHASLRVTAINGRIMISGTAPDGPTVDKAVMIAKQFGTDVINSVNVLQPQQVMLEVRFVEATRQAGRDLGVQWNVFGQHNLANIGNRTPSSQLPVTNTGGGLFSQPNTTSGGPNTGTSGLGISPVVVAGVLSGTAPFGVIVSKMLAAGIETDLIINALEQKGVARALAEPNLVALSGDTASFLAGGEYPIPVPGALGTITIDYKRYGVGLAFTPTVLSGGLINMKIEPEVSQLDFSHMVTIGGLSVPPLIVRRASTTVELRDGQSFVIGGLLQSVNQNAISQMPWLGDMPVLGALFRSTSYQKQGDRPRHHRHAAAGSPGAARRRHQDAARLRVPAERRRSVPDGQDRTVARQGAARQRRPAARVHRPCARSAEGRRRCALGPQLRTIAATALLGAMLGGCSEYYFDRRDTVTLHSGDAVATNRVTQMIDPWPAASGQRNIAYNGEKAATAAERYRTGRSHPAGERHHQFGRLCGGAAAGAIHGEAPGIASAPNASGARQQPDQVAATPNKSRQECEWPSLRARRTRPWWRCSPPIRRSSSRCARPSAPAGRSSCGSSPAPSQASTASTPTASPSSSSISTPAGPTRWRRWSG